MGVNKLSSVLKDMYKMGGGGGELPEKQTTPGEKHSCIQDNDVPSNQIVQITGHKNLQSINNFSSLRERQMENISNILSSTVSTNRDVSDVSRGAFHFPAGASPFHHYQLAASLSTSSVHENQLQTMFYGNTITGGVFNIIRPRHKVQ